MNRILAPGSFYGESLRALRAGDFMLCESRYAPDLRIPTHAHEHAFFYYVIEGDSTESYGRRARAAAAGTLVFHPQGETHANHWHAGGGRCLHLEIASAALARLREHGAALDHPRELHGGWPAWLAARLHRELCRADSLSPLALEGLALELIAEVSRPGEPFAGERRPPWLHPAREFLHARFAESVSLADVAAASGVHTSHFARVFRREMGCSVGEYLRGLRVEYACRELAATETPLAEIALAAGFTDQSHLSRCFRRHLGMTPAQFRRCCRTRTADTDA
jgi:AraC family transcriptional regulator